ncbi:MAG: hypothetical protein KOO62_12970 [candidate division Zixibacteria bacterium]|nr:hypothetical protein [candidate division Zixibacteria bacterium]
MIASLNRRVGKAEDALVIGEDQVRFQQLVRQNYNLRTMSTEGLDVGILCLLGSIDVPMWVQNELDRPIPDDAPSNRIREAERAAHDEIAAVPWNPTADRLGNVEPVVADCFKSVSKFAGRPISSFDDFREWLSKRGDRPGYQNVMDAIQDHGGYDGTKHTT